MICSSDRSAIIVSTYVVDLIESKLPHRSGDTENVSLPFIECFSDSPPVVPTHTASFHLATGNSPVKFHPHHSSSTATPLLLLLLPPLPSISPRTDRPLPLPTKAQPPHLQPLNSGDGIAKPSNSPSPRDGTPRVNSRATPWTDFAPSTRSTATRSPARYSRTSSRSVQKPSAGYYAASGSHRERSAPAWQRGKEGAEKTGSREKDRRRRTAQLRSSRTLDRTTQSSASLRPRRESSQKAGSFSNDVSRSGRAKMHSIVRFFYGRQAK